MPIRAAVLDNTKPAIRTFSNPHFLINNPVKKEGANIPNMCHCAIKAVSTNVWPYSWTIASGVAAIISTMTPHPITAQSTATT